MMMRMRRRRTTSRHLLCFLLLFFQLCWAEDTKKDERKTENITFWSHAKTRRLFARQKISAPEHAHVSLNCVELLWSVSILPAADRSVENLGELSSLMRTSDFCLLQKHKSNVMTPARRCGRLMESCSSHVPCCDPCASCRCRLFNTICHCWRMNPLCLRRT